VWPAGGRNVTFTAFASASNGRSRHLSRRGASVRRRGFCFSPFAVELPSSGPRAAGSAGRGRELGGMGGTGSGNGVSGDACRAGSSLRRARGPSFSLQDLELVAADGGRRVPAYLPKDHATVALLSSRARAREAASSGALPGPNGRHAGRRAAAFSFGRVGQAGWPPADFSSASRAPRRRCGRRAGLNFAIWVFSFV